MIISISNLFDDGMFINNLISRNLSNHETKHYASFCSTAKFSNSGLIKSRSCTKTTAHSKSVIKKSSGSLLYYVNTPLPPY